MTKDYWTNCRIILESNNGDLEDYPRKTEYSIEFDATDLTIQGWIDEFKKVLFLQGHTPKTINEYLGDE